LICAGRFQRWISITKIAILLPDTPINGFPSQLINSNYGIQIT